MTNYIPTIAEFARLFNYPSPKYPTLALVSVEAVRENIHLIPSNVSFGFYTIGLKKHLKGYLKYGRKQYDFQEGVLVFTAPRQVLNYDNLIVDRSEGWYLFFESTFLRNTNLERNIDQYRFFDYEVNESLHLSNVEEERLNTIFQSLFDEYNNPIDQLSKKLLVNHLESILTYAQRYYKRQFITRNEVETDFLIRFEEVLNENCNLKTLETLGIPTVKKLAQQMNLSSGYLSDALRNATGLSVQKHIHLRIISIAKEQLLNQNLSISEVAYKLGFESPNYFSRLFKKIEGITPTAFIEMN